MKYILPIICTGFPGLQKLILISLCISLIGAESAGIYSREISLIYFISLLTSIGYGASLLKKIPIITGLSKKKKYVGELIFSTISFSFIVYVAGLIVQYSLTITIYHFPFLSLIMLLSNNIYQIIRHYYLADRSYISLISLDIIYTFLIVLSLFFKELDLYYKIASITSFLFVFIYVLVKFGWPRWSSKTTFDIESYKFSLNTLVSGGIPTLIPVFFSLIVSNDKVAVIALFMSVISIFSLFPRAMINYLLPVISKTYGENESALFELMESSKKKLILIISVSYLIAILVPKIVGLALDFFDYDLLFIQEERSNTVLYISIVVYFMSTSLPILNGAYLFVSERQAYNIKSNLFYFLACLFGGVVMVLFVDLLPKYAFLFIAFVGLIRALYLNIVVKRFFNAS